MWRSRVGSGGNLANFAGTLIEPGRTTLADLLQGAGYFTGLVGKWHQGIDWKLRDENAREVVRLHTNYQDFRNIDFASPALKGPNDYGFEYSFGTAGSAEMNPCTFIENNRVTVIPNHCCSVTNLFNEIVAVRDGVVEKTWLVAARGALQ